MPSTSSSSLTNEVPKPPTREQPPTRPPYTPTLGGQAPHSHQFPRTRKMFDKGPEQVEEHPAAECLCLLHFVFNCCCWNWFKSSYSHSFWGVCAWICVCVFVQAAEDGDEPVGHRNYISPALQTGLCDWSAKYFAQPVMKVVSPFKFLCILMSSRQSDRKHFVGCNMRDASCCFLHCLFFLAVAQQQL